ncbi:MAG: hypothetical protein U1F56_10290 [Rubrivivax sp.]
MAAGALLVAGAMAADADPARVQLEQRLKLSASMMSDSATAQRIAASGNTRAIAHLDEGRVHHARAVDLLDKGDIPAARAAADEALKHLGLARRLAPDAPARQGVARQRYGEVDASVERLIAAWRQRAGTAAAQDSDLVAALGLVGNARRLAEESRYEDALQALGAAEGHVLAGMNRLLHARTLDYTARAQTPAEEFELELARHRGLMDLVPLAIRDLSPRTDARVLVDRYAEASATLATQAQIQARAGDLPAALANLRNALQYVQRALTSAGLVIPQPTGN